MKSQFLWEYTSDELSALAPGLVAIQPAASVEQHGPHLPVGTDSLIGAAFIRRLADRFARDGYPGLFLPSLYYGKSSEHIRYPGTITFSTETYLSVLLDIGRSCARAGFPKLVFLNTHGGNRELLDVAARELRIETDLDVFVVQPSAVPLEREKMGCALTPEELRFGVHAGRTETAAILALRPELVDTQAFQAAYPPCLKGLRYIGFSGGMSFGWTADDLSETGAIGGPAGASAREGEQWLTNITEQTFLALLEIQDYVRRPAGGRAAGPGV